MDYQKAILFLLIGIIGGAVVVLINPGLSMTTKKGKGSFQLSLFLCAKMS